MHSFSYKSHNLDFNGSKTYTVATGLFVIATSHTFTVKKSRENMYLPFLLKQASLMDVTISVKKFFLEGSSASANVIAVLSHIPDYNTLFNKYSIYLSHVTIFYYPFTCCIQKDIVIGWMKF